MTPSWGFASSGNYFDVLGVQPALGRFFHAADEHGPGSAPYVVISYDFWRAQLNRDPKVLGLTVELNKHPLTVIGVAPEGFHGTDATFWPDYWIPVMNAAQVTGFDDLPYRDHFSFDVFGRFKPRVTPTQATNSLNALASQMAKDDPKDDGLTARVRVPGPAGDDVDPTKMVLLGILLLAFLVLFAACANLASIFAARAADRSGELAIRLAIGSSRWIVLRQLVVEAVLVSIAGGVFGSIFARLALGVLGRLRLSWDFPTHFPILPDARVYMAALTMLVAGGLLFGLLPGRQVWQTDVIQTIKSGCRVASFSISLDSFPSPKDLWSKYRAWKGLNSDEEAIVLQDYFDDGSGKAPRYYQTNAINATIEAIAKGQNRILLVMATGTGKTHTAFQIIWRLWKAGRKKRILFLADRNVLADQTMVNDFRPFGAAMAKLSTGSKTIERADGAEVELTTALDKKRRIDTAYEVYLGLYQAITGPEERQLTSSVAITFFVLPYSVAANSRTLISSRSSHLRSVSLPT